MRPLSSSLDLFPFSPLEVWFAKRILKTFHPSNEEKALLLAFLMASSLEGSSCIDIQDRLVPSTTFLWERAALPVDEEKRKKGEEKILRGAQELFLSQETFQGKIAFYKSKIYLQKDFFYESKIIREIIRLLQERPEELFDRQRYQRESKALLKGGFLFPQQKEALEKSLDHSLTLIVGGPGTGKTYIAGEMISLFSSCFLPDKKKKFLVCLAAPTGRAALHLQHAIEKKGFTANTSCSFSTLHALLQIKESFLYSSFRHHWMMADLIIVDEASMIDPRLMALLLSSILPSSRLVLMGDMNQLPPIEGGNIFSEMARKKSLFNKEFAIFLNENVRFENRGIDLFSQGLLHTERKEETSFYPGVEMVFLEEEKKMEERFFLEGEFFFHPPFLGEIDIEKCFILLQKTRLLSPLRNGSLGIDFLNQKFLSTLFQKASLGQKLAIPLMIARNDAQRELYNGTIGILVFPFRGEKNPFSPKDQVYFYEEKKMRSYSLHTLPYYESSFCLSVHKSQGSEFSHVTLLLPPFCERFGREMLYTAVTRAKKTLLVIGGKSTWKELLKRKTIKNSSLLERLQEREKS